MVNKITSSLRKSISAEKENLTKMERSGGSVGIQHIPKKAAGLAKAEPKIKILQTTAQINTIVDEENKVNRFSMRQPNLHSFNLGNNNSLLQNNLDMIRVAANKTIEVNHKLMGYYLHSLVSLNDGVKEYLQKISDISNLNNLYGLNLDFLSGWRKRQKETADKCLSLFTELYTRPDSKY